MFDLCIAASQQGVITLDPTFECSDRPIPAYQALSTVALPHLESADAASDYEGKMTCVSSNLPFAFACPQRHRIVPLTVK